MLPAARALADMHSADCPHSPYVPDTGNGFRNEVVAAAKANGQGWGFPVPHLVPIIRADSEVPFYSLNLTLPPTDMAQPGTSESLRTVREYCEPRS